LLQAVRNAPGQRTIVNVTTDKCYSNREWLWGYRENDELGGFDPYSNSKACAELVTQSFRDSFFPPSELARHRVGIATARAGNVIGGGDWTRDQLIPDIVRAFGAGEPVMIRQPASVRPWQHVLDCLSGYLLLAEKVSSDAAQFGGAWNFGPRLADVRPVSWIADSLARSWGGRAEWKVDAAAHPHEARTLVLDSSKASQLLGWQPKLELAQALSWTASWYKSLAAGREARDLCLEQVDEYLRL
jgi:CDP-glucose 4,6-dehydratase